MHLPRISVIIAVLNMGQFLEKTLKSILSQKYSGLELIIMDGGSTDDTLLIINKYASKLHYFQSQTDKGHIDACNNALPYATGDFIVLINADDVILPGLFQKVAEVYLKNKNALMISCGVAIADSQDNIIKTVTKHEEIEFHLKNILFGMPMINARFFHRSLFKKYGVFKSVFPGDRSYYISNDREFLTRLCLHNITSEVIPEIFYIYCSHPLSLTFSKTNIIKIHQEHVWLANQLLTHKDLTLMQSHVIRNWRAYQIVILTYLFLNGRKYTLMFSTLWLGFKTDCLKLVMQLARLTKLKILGKFI